MQAYLAARPCPASHRAPVGDGLVYSGPCQRVLAALLLFALDLTLERSNTSVGLKKEKGVMRIRRCSLSQLHRCKSDSGSNRRMSFFENKNVLFI